MNNTLTFTPTAADIAAELPAALPAPAPAQAKPNTVAKASMTARIWRTLVLHGDMLIVIALMAACGVYGIYALTQMTGF